MPETEDRPIGWRDVFMSYPCPMCGAAAGEQCRTRGGKPSATPHVKRAAAATRCTSCGDRLHASEPGDVCPYCRMVSKLTLERFRPGELDE